MTKGQIAIAELRRRLGPCDPVDGFKAIDTMLAERDFHLDNFEHLLCAMMFDKGMVIGMVERVTVAGTEAPEYLLAFLALPSPGVGVNEPPMLVQPEGSIIQ